MTNNEHTTVHASNAQHLHQQHHSLLLSLSHKKKQVRNLQLLRNEIETQASDSYETYIRLRQINERALSRKMDLHGDSCREKRDKFSILDRENEPHQSTSGENETVREPTVGLNEQDISRNGDVSNFRHASQSHSPHRTSSLPQHDTHASTTDESSSTTRIELNNLRKIHKRVDLVHNWFTTQLEEISALHMNQKELNQQTRTKQQRELRNLEEERLVSIQNASTYQKEISRLTNQVQTQLEKDCVALRGGISQEKQRADEELSAMARQLLK